MITEWGMSDELGTITFGNNNNDQVFLGRDLGRDRNYSEAVAYSIDKEVKHIMDECYERAMQLLKENRDKLDTIAQTLMERETIEAAEFVALMEGRSLEELDKQKAKLLEEQKQAPAKDKAPVQAEAEASIVAPKAVVLEKQEDPSAESTAAETIEKEQVEQKQE